jgi:hypothetical protein
MSNRRGNFPTNNPPSPPTSDTAAHVFLGIGVTIALILGILGLFIGVSNNNLLSGSTHQLLIYDLTEQPLLDANTWTNVRYNHTLFNSDRFSLIGGGGDTIKCLKTGTFKMFFKLQTSVNNSIVPPLPIQCTSCFLKYAARATIQYQGLGLIYEIPTSHTHNNNGQLLVNELIFSATTNDLIRIQLISPCPYLILSAYNGENNLTSVSSSLLIY